MVVIVYIVVVAVFSFMVVVVVSLLIVYGAGVSVVGVIDISVVTVVVVFGGVGVDDVVSVMLSVVYLFTCVMLSLLLSIHISPLCVCSVYVVDTGAGGVGMCVIVYDVVHVGALFVVYYVVDVVDG